MSVTVSARSIYYPFLRKLHEDPDVCAEGKESHLFYKLRYLVFSGGVPMAPLFLRLTKAQSAVTAMSDDDTYFSEALAEYRDESGEDRDFADLDPPVQHEILKRAQGLKTQREREKRG